MVTTKALAGYELDRQDRSIAQKVVTSISASVASPEVSQVLSQRLAVREADFLSQHRDRLAALIGEVRLGLTGMPSEVTTDFPDWQSRLEQLWYESGKFVLVLDVDDEDIVYIIDGGQVVYTNVLSFIDQGNISQIAKNFIINQNRPYDTVIVGTKFLKFDKIGSVVRSDGTGVVLAWYDSLPNNSTFSASASCEQTKYQWYRSRARKSTIYGMYDGCAHQWHRYQQPHGVQDESKYMVFRNPPANIEEAYDRIQGAYDTAADGAPLASQKPQLFADLLTATNAERTKVGLPTLTVNSLLGISAQEHADDMATNRYVGHVAPDGTTMENRVDALGYNYLWI